MDTKRVIFVGGETEGLNRFSKYLESRGKVWHLNMNNMLGKIATEYFHVERKVENEGVKEVNPEYFQLVEDLRNLVTLDLGYELQYVGEGIKRLLDDKETGTLVVHRSNEETRKAMVSEDCDKKLENLNVYRFWIGKADEAPEEYDRVIYPNSEHFDNILDNYFDEE